MAGLSGHFAFDPMLFNKKGIVAYRQHILKLNPFSPRVQLANHGPRPSQCMSIKIHNKI
jgi:hypothetical protein